MSTDPTGAVLTLDDAAVPAGGRQTASEQTSELTGIATAIERIEALLGAGGPEAEDSEAIERIADIAFVLHERDVEASLCDALDAAVRELANANAAKRANVLHVRRAAEMLRELSQRVADMVALLQLSAPDAADDTTANEAAPDDGRPVTAENSASEDALDGEIPREGLFVAELLEDDDFARAVAELAASLPALAEPVDAVVVTLREPADLVADEPPTAPVPDEGDGLAPREPADFVAEEPISASEPDEIVGVALDTPVDFMAEDSASVSKLSEADVVALDEPTALVAEEPSVAPEPEGAVPETRSNAEALAADASSAAFALQDAVAETQPEAASLAADDSARAAEPEEAAREPRHDLAELPANEPASEQSAITDGTAIEQTLAAESSIVESGNEQPASEVTAPVPDAAAEGPMHDAVSHATPASEDTLSNMPSGEDTVLKSADTPAQPPWDFRDASPDHSSVNGHAIVSVLDADSPHIASDAASSPEPEAEPENDAALAPNTLPIAAPTMESELPPSAEAPSPADAKGATSAGQPPNQNILRHNSDDEPTHVADESLTHDADEGRAESAAEIKEEPPPRFAESSQTLLPELALVDPQDDPGDLFEPLAATAPPIAAENLAETQSESKISAHSAENEARSAATAADPLAAMHTLSAEELLALFT